jgi:hypothetical protein
MSNEFQGIQQSLDKAGEDVAALSGKAAETQQKLNEINQFGKILKNSRTALLPIVLPDIIFDTINSGVDTYTNIAGKFGPRYQLFNTRLIKEETKTQNDIVAVIYTLETSDSNNVIESDINGMMVELKCNPVTKKESSRKTTGYNKAGDPVVTVNWTCLSLTPVNALNGVDSVIENIEHAVADAKSKIHKPSIPSIPKITVSGIVTALLPDLPTFPLELPTEADVTEYVENKITVLKRKQQSAVIQKNKIDVAQSKTPFTRMNEQIAAGNRTNNNRG